MGSFRCVGMQDGDVYKGILKVHNRDGKLFVVDRRRVRAPYPSTSLAPQHRFAYSPCFPSPT